MNNLMPEVYLEGSGCLVRRGGRGFECAEGVSGLGVMMVVFGG